MKQALLPLLLLCSALAASATDAGPDHPFPAIAGWTLTRGEVVYSRANLYDLIDGAADQFLSYGFVDLYTAEYRGRENIDVRVELYRHDSRNNAFGMYAAERSPEYHFIDMGTQGYIEDGVLNFLSGHYYVKVTTHQAGPSGRSAMSLVAEKVNAGLKQGKSWPSTLHLLPEKGKVPNTDGYIAENFLGYSILHSAFFADYAEPGRLRLFVIELKNAGEARTMAGAYLKYANKRDAPPGEGAYLVKDPNNGPVAIFLEGRRICGVVNCESERTRVKALEALRRAIAQRGRARTLSGRPAERR